MGHSSEKERRITGKNLEFVANLQADSIPKNMIIHQILENIFLGIFFYVIFIIGNF